ncbi:MAG: hypothetical protein WAM25_09400, partial [Candidatus Acidiferrales bacterium]
MRKTTNRAIELLRSSFFFIKLLRAIRKTGLVAERRNALVVYVVGTSRLIEKPLCLFVKGPSGVGKNFVTDNVLGFLPSSEVQQLTSSSTRSWNYRGKQLAHKVVYIKERNEEAGSVHPTRLLISERGLVHVVTVKKRGRFVTERRVTKGPISSISTTTQDRVEVDDETRHISVWLDETPDQTTRIMEAAVYNQKGLKVGDRKVWHKVQQLIQKRAALSIEFPDWFKNIVPYVRSDNLWARRYFPAFLQACRTVALIRSFCRKQRMGRKARRIIVRFSDFAVTALIFNPVFEHSIDKADDQDLETRHYVDRLSFRKGGNGVRANDLADEKDISADRAYGLLRKAANAGTIFRSNQPSKANLKLYLPAKPRPFLPDPAEVF